MEWPEAFNLARNGQAVRRAAWLQMPVRANASVAFVRGVGSTRAVAVWRQAGREDVLRAGEQMTVTIAASILTFPRAVRDGERLIFLSITGSGLNVGQTYYVRDVSGLTARLATTEGGAAATFASMTGGVVQIGHLTAQDWMAEDWEVVA